MGTEVWFDAVTALGSDHCPGRMHNGTASGLADVGRPAWHNPQEFFHHRSPTLDEIGWAGDGKWPKWPLSLRLRAAYHQ